MIAMRWARSLGLVVALCGVLAACETTTPTTEFPEITFAKYGPIRLDVGRIEVVRGYVPPAKKPNVDHLFPVAPVAAAERWANDRLRAVGSSGVAQATITRADVIEVPLKRTGGVAGVFTKDQSERYDSKIEIQIRILGADGRERAMVLSRAERSRTVGEDISVIDREKVWYEMTQAMMNDINASLQRQINEHMRPYLR